MSTITHYAHAAPAHTGALYIACRPLPGRVIGRSGGFVHDVSPQYEDLTRRDDGQPVVLITPAGLERLAEQLLAEDGRYTRAAYEEVGEWRPEEIARVRGHAVITITPDPSAGPLIDATPTDDLKAGLGAAPSPRYVTVTVVVRTDAHDPSEAVDQVLAGRPEHVMWSGAEEGVTAAARAGGADPDAWEPADDAPASTADVVTVEPATGPGTLR